MISQKDILTPSVVESMQNHAIAEYPNECVGVVTKSGYLPMQNMASDKTNTAKWPDKELHALIKDNDVIAMVHSHPDGHNCPSAADMNAQYNYNLPWVIVWTNGTACYQPFVFGDMVACAPLMDRGYQHGVTDCYSFVRDWYNLNFKVELPEFPRDWKWWELGADLYTEGFRKAGFSVIKGEPALGDLLLYKVASKNVNHGAIYDGVSQILHHPSSQSPFDPSKRPQKDSAARWERFCVMKLRYTHDT